MKKGKFRCVTFSLKNKLYIINRFLCANINNNLKCNNIFQLICRGFYPLHINICYSKFRTRASVPPWAVSVKTVGAKTELADTLNVEDVIKAIRSFMESKSL